MEALGRLFDIGLAVAPVDINTSDAATGKRIWMGDCAGIVVFAFTGTGGADDLTFDVQQATAYTGGTSGDLDVPTYYHIKAETALDNDEAWVKVTQAAASECTVVGATYGAQQKIFAVDIPATALSDGYAWISVNVACTTSTSQLIVVGYLKHDLHVQRRPTNLPNLLNPGAANA